MKHLLSLTIICASILSVSIAGHAQNPIQWEQGLSTEQQSKAQAIIQESYPRIKELRKAARTKVRQLEEFCYSSEDDHEELVRLGRELQATRDALRTELIQLDARLMKEVGVSLHGYRGRHHRALEKASRSLSVHKYEAKRVHH